MTQTEPTPRRCTGIVLQGGGALGAFEFGVLQALYARRPGFTPAAISGISIGAVTAAVLAAPRSGDPLGSLDTLWRERLTVRPTWPTVPFAPGCPACRSRSFRTGWRRPGRCSATGGCTRRTRRCSPGRGRPPACTEIARGAADLGPELDGPADCSRESIEARIEAGYTQAYDLIGE